MIYLIFNGFLDFYTFNVFKLYTHRYYYIGAIWLKQKKITCTILINKYPKIKILIKTNKLIHKSKTFNQSKEKELKKIIKNYLTMILPISTIFMTIIQYLINYHLIKENYKICFWMLILKSEIIETSFLHNKPYYLRKSHKQVIFQFLFVLILLNSILIDLF